MATPSRGQPAAQPPAPADRAAAVRRARQQFMAGRRVEMGSLAAELGVSRVTLNRWVGSRDQLLGEINWSLAEPTLRQALTQAPGSGADAVAHTLEALIRAVLAADFMNVFLRRERDIALRILTTSHSDMQRNLIAFVEQLLRDEIGAPPPALDFADLAYLVVRLAESFCYIDMITGGKPDAAKVGHAIKALLT
jgi:AcrR family transcriptional regulator